MDAAREPYQVAWLKLDVENFMAILAAAYPRMDIASQIPTDDSREEPDDDKKPAAKTSKRTGEKLHSVTL